MKLMRVEMELETGKAVYDAAFVVNDFDSPVLMIGVSDFEEAQELVSTIERSRARKKKDPQPAAATASPGASGVAARGQEERKPSPKCIATGCTFDADSFAATDGEKPTPAPLAAKRTKKILEDLARKPDLDDATTKTTALPAGTSPGPKAA